MAFENIPVPPAPSPETQEEDLKKEIKARLSTKLTKAVSALFAACALSACGPAVGQVDAARVGVDTTHSVTNPDTSPTTSRIAEVSSADEGVAPDVRGVSAELIPSPDWESAGVLGMEDLRAMAVVDAQGQSIDGAIVLVYSDPAGEHEVAYASMTDSMGRFRLEGALRANTQYYLEATYGGQTAPFKKTFVYTQ